ncbi:DUF6542 domain-containing protein [Streptomyces sp. SPB162]|uniref:DUF6542 domain-containing protein n=1 Tax=Streptomyces sp. SPB162 TaxID=2940560 RepID=UPI002404C860|nr:DUF6542 domain-containing protein [Streptomyces sp. SPB162]MDF9815373.1 hypothetical protein [Streptomyces sp. SPB162]
MEQHSARTGTRNGTENDSGDSVEDATGGGPRLPRPARPTGTVGGSVSYRSAQRGPLGALAPAITALARVVRLPQVQPKLTGLGTGVLTVVVTLAGGGLDALLFDGPGVLFGLLFVAVCVTSALYVRPYDLVAAPIAAPIAFATAIALTGDDNGGGFVGHLLGIFTGLALLTGWLYTGTLLAATIVGVRALQRSWRRRRSRRCSAERRGRSRR